MQFLKTLFWVALAVALVLFANANWTAVTLRLWGGLEADVKLPVLIIAAFLLGLVPMLAIHRARIWSMKRRIESVERQAMLNVSAPGAADPSARTEGASTP
jgi:putative membrane protein